MYFHLHLVRINVFIIRYVCDIQKYYINVYIYTQCP